MHVNLGKVWATMKQSLEGHARNIQKCRQTRITVQPGAKIHKTMQLKVMHAILCKKCENTQNDANMYETCKSRHEHTKHTKQCNTVQCKQRSVKKHRGDKRLRHNACF